MFSKVMRNAKRVVTGKRVARACETCRRNRVRCDESRPCRRCILYGTSETCDANKWSDAQSPIIFSGDARTVSEDEGNTQYALSIPKRTREDEDVDCSLEKQTSGQKRKKPTTGNSSSVLTSDPPQEHWHMSLGNQIETPANTRPKDHNHALQPQIRTSSSNSQRSAFEPVVPVSSHMLQRPVAPPLMLQALTQFQHHDPSICQHEPRLIIELSRQLLQQQIQQNLQEQLRRQQQQQQQQTAFDAAVRTAASSLLLRLAQSSVPPTGADISGFRPSTTPVAVAPGTTVGAQAPHFQVAGFPSALQAALRGPVTFKTEPGLAGP